MKPFFANDGRSGCADIPKRSFMICLFIFGGKQNSRRASLYGSVCFDALMPRGHLFSLCGERRQRRRELAGFLLRKTGGDVSACTNTYYKGLRPQGLETAPC